jgi:hypothetical protein
VSLNISPGWTSETYTPYQPIRTKVPLPTGDASTCCVVLQRVHACYTCRFCRFRLHFFNLHLCATINTQLGYVYGVGTDHVILMSVSPLASVSDYTMLEPNGERLA